MTIVAAFLSTYTRDWLDLLVRWLHVIAAIGWIGSSFYFVLLDQSLRKPKDAKDVEDGVGGELWEVHGGGFYHVKKYTVAPPTLPDHLAWFKWEAYATWVSGFTLLVGLYWLDASTYMIDPRVADLTSLQAVAISAGLLIASWVIYDVLCRMTKGRDRLLSVLLMIAIAIAAWGTSHLFSPRAAWLQVGAMIGTIMAGSVLFNIIPAHWELIHAKEAGRDPDPAPGIEAKRRSVHNNYFTLPVLITMLAGHFSFFTAQKHSWIILLCFMALGAFSRLFYNLRHKGTTHWWMVVAFFAALLTMYVVLKPDDEQPAAAKPSHGELVDGKALFSKTCAACHTLADANAKGQVGPNLDAAKPEESLVRDRVTNGKGGMPSFSSKYDDAEIAAIATYVASASRKDASDSKK